MTLRLSPAERARLFIVLFVSFVITEFSYLWILGERRIDVYYVMYVLAYLVTVYTVLPASITARTRMKILTAAMVAVALGVIGWRVYQVLK